MCRHAHGAVVGVTGLRLNAADGEHETARRVAPVRPKRQGARHVEGRYNLTGGSDLDLVSQTRAAQCVVHKGKPFKKRHTHMVGKFYRRRSGAAFSAVDHDEIGHDTSLQHRLDHAHELAPVPDTKLEPHGFATRQLPQLCDELHHLNRCAESGVCGRRDAVDTHRDAARLGNLWRDLGRGQHPAMSRLGPLAEFDLDHLDLFKAGRLAKLVRVEGPVIVAAAEITRSHLKDQISATFLVIFADRPLASVVSKSAHPRTGVQCKDCVGAQRAEAHGRYVVKRGVIGLRAIWPANHHTEIAVLNMDRADRMRHPGVARVIGAFTRPERTLVFDPLGALVDKRAGVA